VKTLPPRARAFCDTRHLSRTRVSHGHVTVNSLSHW